MKKSEMNKWQQIFIDQWYNGKVPQTKSGRRQVDLLGYMKKHVKVEYGDGKVEDLLITEDDVNIPEGKIDVIHLAQNLIFWVDVRGFKVSSY